MMQDTFLLKVDLPLELKRNKIATFYPVLNPSETLMMIAVRFEQPSIRHVYLEEKYHGMVLIDL